MKKHLVVVGMKLLAVIGLILIFLPPFLYFNGFHPYDILLSFFSGVTLLIVYLFYLRKSKQNPTKSKSNAIVILEERYAKGEITEEEYEKMKKKLEEEI